MRKRISLLLGFSTILALSTAFSMPTNQQFAAMQKMLKQQQAQLTRQSHQMKLMAADIKRLTSRTKAVTTTTKMHTSTTSTNITHAHIAAHSVLHMPKTQSPIRFITVNPKNESVLTQSTDDDGEQPVLVIGHSKANLLLAGKISPMIFTATDPKKTNLFFASNSISSSSLSANTLFEPTSGWHIGSNLELDFYVNQSNLVSQTTPSPTSNVDIDKAEVFVHSHKLGLLLLGKGDSASDNTSLTDLSDTALVSRTTADDIGGGLFFRDKSTGILSTTTVSNAINGLDGLPGALRIRYDTPEFAGLLLSVSAIEGDEQDIALKYGHRFGQTKFAAQIGFTTPQTINTTTPTPTSGKELTSSAAVLFSDGISLSAAYGGLLVNQLGRDDPYYFHIKPGYQKNFFDVGNTAMSIDMGRYYNFAQNDDCATTYGLQLLQNINPWNLVMYMGYRNFHLNQPGTSFDSLNLFMMGALYKF